MIIFNGKGFIVALISAILLIILILIFHLNQGLSFLLTGIGALFISFKLTNKNEGFFALPSFFIIPTHLYALLIIYVGILSLKEKPSFFEKKNPKDNREKFLRNEIDTLNMYELSGLKTNAKNLKEYMNNSIIHQLKTENISYLLKENQKTNAYLLLIKYDKFDSFGDEDRAEFVSLIKKYFNNDSIYLSKKIYIAILDEGIIKTTYTPEKGLKTNSFLTSEKELKNYF